jgi:hypothetical protein
LESKNIKNKTFCLKNLIHTFGGATRDRKVYPKKWVDGGFDQKTCLQVMLQFSQNYIVR